MKNKELVTELAARMGWTAQEVTETLSVLSSVVSSRLVDNDTIYLQGFGQFEVKKKAKPCKYMVSLSTRRELTTDICQSFKRKTVFSPPKTCPGVQTRNDRQE